MIAAKQQEADQLIKAVKLLISKESQKMELSFTYVVWDKVEQPQIMKNSFGMKVMWALNNKPIEKKKKRRTIQHFF